MGDELQMLTFFFKEKVSLLHGANAGNTLTGMSIPNYVNGRLSVNLK